MEFLRFSSVSASARLGLLASPPGTRAGNMMRLSGPAFEVYLRPSNFAELQSLLADSHPAIVFLQIGALQYWSMDIYHTAVLIGLDAMSVALNDPYFAAAQQLTSLPSFEKAWVATGQFAALVRPRRKPLARANPRCLHSSWRIRQESGTIVLPASRSLGLQSPYRAAVAEDTA